MYSALPFLYSAPGNQQCGLPKEQGTTVHCCFCLWLTLSELTMPHSVQQKWVGGCPARSVSKHPALATFSMGPDFTEGAEPNTGHCQRCSGQMCYLLYKNPTLASSHLLCRGHMDSVCVRPCHVQDSNHLSLPPQNPVPRMAGSEALRPCKVQHLQIY